MKSLLLSNLQKSTQAFPSRYLDLSIPWVMLYNSFYSPTKESTHTGLNYDFRLAERWFTWKRTAIIVTFLWIFSSLFFIPNLTGAWGQTGFEKQTFSCTVLHDKDAGLNPLRVILGIGIILAVLIIGVSYFLLIKVRLFPTIA